MLEPALALRPGRVDLAVEIPIPDAAARGRLLDLYSRGLDARIEHPGRIVERTEGMTASFFKELLRAATLAAAEAGELAGDRPRVGASLDELLAEHAAMTRVLLGAHRDEEGEPPPFSSDEFQRERSAGSSTRSIVAVRPGRAAATAASTAGRRASAAASSFGAVRRSSTRTRISSRPNPTPPAAGSPSISIGRRGPPPASAASDPLLEGALGVALALVEIPGAALAQVDRVVGLVADQHDAGPLGTWA